MRPTFFRSACPAIPLTSVPNSSGAMMQRMSRRKIMLRTPQVQGRAGPIVTQDAPPSEHRHQNPYGQRTLQQRVENERCDGAPAKREEQGGG